MAFSNKESNPLHSAASYNTIFTLSGMTEQEIRTRSFLTNAPHDIIARTGGIGKANVQPRQYKDFRTTQDNALFRTLIKADEITKYYEQYQDSIDILDRAHDLFIENVNILSTVGPNAERNLANFTKMEFEIHEPYGITFIEKVRAATALNGFQDYQDAPLLLSIDFRGFNEQGQPMYFGGASASFSQKELGTMNSNSFYHQGISRKIPILIARVDFDVNEGGAKYNVIAVPYTDMAFDDRFKFPRINIPVAENDVIGWTRQVEFRLNEQMQFEIDENAREFKDNYKFIVDPQVLKNAGVYTSESDSIHTTGDPNSIAGDDPLSENRTGAIQFKNSAKATSFTALTKFFEDAVRQSDGYVSLTENFWEGFLSSLGYQVSTDTPDSITNVLQSKDFSERIAQNPYIPWFKIKTTVHTDTSRFDNITKMHPKTIIYRAVPYKIHILKLLGAGMSLKADWSQYVRKEYNYLYTGDNVDVQGLRINYKSAYYMRNVREAKDTTETGIIEQIKEAIIKAFGQEKDPEPLLPLRQYPSILKGRATNENTNPRNLKAQEFYDYLTNPEADMMRIELDILGDPAYLCQDVFTPTTDARSEKQSGEVFDTKIHSFNADQFMPCINLRYRLPDDVDEKEGTMFGGDGKKYRDENLFFSGIYQVVKVDSRMDQGQFLQTLTCVRLNNQSGEGAPIDLINSLQRGNKKLKEDKQENIGGKIKKGIKEYMEDVEKIDNQFPV